MKKILAALICLLGIFTTHIYPQYAKQIVNNTGKSSILKQSKINSAYQSLTLAEESKKVLIHYMGWFGSGIDGKHWEYGQPRKPLIGYYNSNSWATQIYHILLSWSCGIDGMVINVKDDYDNQCLKLLKPTLKRLRDIDSTSFNYKFAVSYDDQGMDQVGIDTAITKFTFLKDSIIHDNPSYLKYNDTAVVFIYNYKLDLVKKIPEYLNVLQYDSTLKKVFSTNKPKVLWNESDENVMGIIDVCYPWIQAYNGNWDSDKGSEWGKDYLLDFFWRIDNIPINTHKRKFEFACSAVWPGFDDRSNWKWGSNRWMDRRNGEVYDSTWLLTLHFNKPLPLNWVYIETWNDWNEGSEIEPSTEFGYQYLLSTIKNINKFKKTTISSDTFKFWTARKIYEAADLIERKERNSATYYPCLKKAIKFFILNQYDSAQCYLKYIFDSKQDPCNRTDIIQLKNIGIEIYPNPTRDIINISIKKPTDNEYTIELFNNFGALKQKILFDRNAKATQIDLSGYPSGLYLMRFDTRKGFFYYKILKE
jgi:hypothetical protein